MNPHDIAGVRFHQTIQIQRSVADARRNENNIASADSVSIRTKEILDISASTVQDFIKGVAVKLHLVFCIIDILLAIYGVGIHFQFLVKIRQNDAFCNQ